MRGYSVVKFHKAECVIWCAEHRKEREIPCDACGYPLASWVLRDPCAGQLPSSPICSAVRICYHHIAVDLQQPHASCLRQSVMRLRVL